MPGSLLVKIFRTDSTRLISLIVYGDHTGLQY